jgi:hypothetical protein
MNSGHIQDVAGDIMGGGTIFDVANDYMGGGYIQDAAGDSLNNGVLKVAHIVSGVTATNLGLVGTATLNGIPLLTNLSVTSSGGITNKVSVANNVISLTLANTNAASSGGSTNNAGQFMGVAVVTNSFMFGNGTNGGFMATNNGIVGFVQGSGVATGQTNWVQVSTNGNLTFYGTATFNSTNVLFSGAVVVTNGIASYAPHTPVAVTVGASPFRYTNNTPVAQECWIDDAAALFSLSKNGVQVRSSLAGSSGQFALMPTNVIIITYPVTAPTFTTNVW